MRIKRVNFLIDKKPTGDLAAKRQHARRITPYPVQMQALIDANLLTASYYEEHRDRRGVEQDARDDEAERLKIEALPHAFCEVWRKILRAIGCV